LWGENITVSFYKNAAPADVLTAAEGLLAAFQEELEDATLIFNNDEDEGKFELKDENVAIDIAVYLLGENEPSRLPHRGRNSRSYLHSRSNR